MTAYVALLRAVNVGGRKLIMKDLKAIANELGLGAARTFIASGNLLFTSADSEDRLSGMLKKAIGEHMKAEVPVIVRTAAEMQQAVKDNSFSSVPASKVAAIFLRSKPPTDAIEQASGIADEMLALGKREIYVAYPSGMGRSKLKLPAAAGSTARNMNSVAKMAALLKEME